MKSAGLSDLPKEIMQIILAQDKQSDLKRTMALQELRSYESCRRPAYNTKITKSHIYWKAFRSLLRTGVYEVERLERIVNGRMEANKAYADAMMAIHDDMLNSDHTPITNVLKKKQILHAKKKNEHKKNLHDLRLSKHPELDEEPFLPMFVESHSVLSERYNMAAQNLEEQVAAKVKTLRIETEAEFGVMESLGDAILEELLAAEEETTEAWEKYYNEEAAKLCAGGGTTPQKARDGASASEGGNLVPLSGCSDAWVKEMHYRMSVSFLSLCWEKCAEELSKLFSAVKEAEYTRITKMQEITKTFMEKEISLWEALPTVNEPVLKDFVDKPVDVTKVEEDLKNSISLRAQYYKVEEQSMAKVEEDYGFGLSEELAKGGDFELTSPLQSNKICAVNLLEKRKTRGLTKSWKTVLSVITIDSFMHLFEIPSNLDINCESEIQLAFRAIIPRIITPIKDDKDSISMAGKNPSLWNDSIKPSDSIALKNCKVVFGSKDEQNHEVEIIESIYSSGIKIRRKYSEKRVLLRTKTQEETLKWVDILKDPMSSSSSD